MKVRFHQGDYVRRAVPEIGAVPLSASMRPK